MLVLSRREYWSSAKEASSSTASVEVTAASRARICLEVDRDVGVSLWIAAMRDESSVGNSDSRIERLQTDSMMSSSTVVLSDAEVEAKVGSTCGAALAVEGEASAEALFLRLDPPAAKEDFFSLFPGFDVDCLRGIFLPILIISVATCVIGKLIDNSGGIEKTGKNQKLNAMLPFAPKMFAV
ncbi:hypothetical protein BDZ91DRAFT_724248, partial [Kalaharituber pfeilii]